jgi:hypothetical protein
MSAGSDFSMERFDERIGNNAFSKNRIELTSSNVMMMPLASRSEPAILAICVENNKECDKQISSTDVTTPAQVNTTISGFSLLVLVLVRRSAAKAAHRSTPSYKPRL